MQVQKEQIRISMTAIHQNSIKIVDKFLFQILDEDHDL